LEATLTTALLLEKNCTGVVIGAVLVFSGVAVKSMALPNSREELAKGVRVMTAGTGFETTVVPLPPPPHAVERQLKTPTASPIAI
jgi:hypothetical protein